MRLNYCHIEGGNFGDDLNLLLWPELFPDIAEHHADTTLYGVGTVLGGQKPSGPKVLLGSGSGSARIQPLGDDWRVYWVRGPGTARACAIDEAFALGDPAVLWSGLRRDRSPVAGRIGLIPHHASWSNFDWTHVAAQAGLHPVNPCQPPDEVAAELATCERVLCESLHGAIFCDTLGVPWRAVALAYRFNDFKWRDWLDGLGLSLEATTLAVPLHRSLGPGKALGNALSRLARRGGALARNNLRPVRVANAGDVERVVAALRGLAREDARFSLSTQARRELQREALLECCAGFARDHGLRFAG